MKTFKGLITINEPVTEPVIDESHHVNGMSDLQMLRKALTEELKAINLYERMATEAKDQRVVTLLLDLAHEEKIHGVEIEELIERMDPDYEDAEEKGEEEIEDMFGKDKDGETDGEED